MRKHREGRQEMNKVPIRCKQLGLCDEQARPVRIQGRVCAGAEKEVGWIPWRVRNVLYTLLDCTVHYNIQG